MLLLLLITAFLLLFFLAPLGITIRYTRDNKKDDLKIILSLFWGLLKIRLDKLSGSRKKRRKGKSLYPAPGTAVFRILLQESGRVKELFRHKIICTEYRAIISFSLGEASKTGMVAGILWSLAGFSGRLKYYLVYKCKPQIAINPCYDESSFIEVDFSKKIYFRTYLLFYLFTVAARATFRSLLAGMKNRNKAVPNTPKEVK